MAIHGNKSQAARTRALSEFKDGSLQVLVATDIAARGIDIDQLPHVVNYDLPNVPEDYVHRIGRTGRAGATGAGGIAGVRRRAHHAARHRKADQARHCRRKSCRGSSRTRTRARSRSNCAAAAAVAAARVTAEALPARALRRPSSRKVPAGRRAVKRPDAPRHHAARAAAADNKKLAASSAASSTGAPRAPVHSFLRSADLSACRHVAGRPQHALSWSGFETINTLR